MTAITLNKRARAFGAFALLFCSLCLPACSTPEAKQQISVPEPDISAWRQSTAIDPNAGFANFIGQIVKSEHNFMECPEDYICWNGLYTLTVEPLEVTSGNPNIGQQNCTISAHSPIIRRGVPIPFRAVMQDDGKWVMDCSEVL